MNLYSRLLNFNQAEHFSLTHVQRNIGQRGKAAVALVKLTDVEAGGGMKTVELFGKSTVAGRRGLLPAVVVVITSGVRVRMSPVRSTGSVEVEGLIAGLYAGGQRDQEEILRFQNKKSS